VDEAGRRGIRVLLDLVPNHTSEHHPWFVDARSDRAAGHRAYYVWADPRPDGGPPNNWVSSFGGPAWTLDPGTGQYYLHNHLESQPDLNWWDPAVRAEFDRIMEFWFDRGVAGFRIDVCNVVIKDALLRDNPPATADDDLDAQLFGQRSVYNANRPEVHDVIRHWRQLSDRYPDRVLVGETPVPVADLARYYGDGHDELHLAFNFPFLNAPLAAGPLRAVVEEVEAALPDTAWPAWTGSNHDMGRLATRWAGGDPAAARAALLVLLCLRGTPVLYQGDEIGLCDAAVAHEAMRDPLGVRYWPYYDGRDGCRTPMPWHAGDGAGFCPPGVTPWLPVPDTSRTVADQRDDPDSHLSLTRRLVAARRQVADLSDGPYRTLPAPEGCWVFQRGGHHRVAVNLGDAPAGIEGLAGTVVVGTDRAREGSAVGDRITLDRWEGLVVRTPG
jgi:alpha-glucosidase